jgi:hypothetical protein
MTLRARGRADIFGAGNLGGSNDGAGHSRTGDQANHYEWRSQE